EPRLGSWGPDSYLGDLDTGPARGHWSCNPRGTPPSVKRCVTQSGNVSNSLPMLTGPPEAGLLFSSLFARGLLRVAWRIGLLAPLDEVRDDDCVDGEKDHPGDAVPQI